MNTMRVRKSLLSFLGVRSNSLEKLEIYYEDGTPGDFGGGPIKVLFNPSELKFNYDTQWKSNPIPGSIAGGYYRLEFQNCQPVTLGIDLFFDTYEGDPNKKFDLTGFLSATVLPSFLSSSPSGVEVLKYTAQLEKLAKVDQDMHRPPRCQLWWGSYCLIEGVLTKMSEDFQYFLADGTPVRASLNCTFQEYVPYEEAKSIYELHSPDVHRTRTVRRGDTLSGIAQAEYNDASKWRAIARANGIHDPRAIRPGQVLTIPKLR